ncbi:hypothetical protein J4210_01600 [Candidatus Woesearchaeota archaeon]|nr:hypothetical protein [Candidatus Woesearchaeota archaeon]
MRISEIAGEIAGNYPNVAALETAVTQAYRDHFAQFDPSLTPRILLDRLQEGGYLSSSDNSLMVSPDVTLLPQGRTDWYAVREDKIAGGGHTRVWIDKVGSQDDLCEYLELERDLNGNSTLVEFFQAASDAQVQKRAAVYENLHHEVIVADEQPH